MDGNSTPSTSSAAADTAPTTDAATTVAPPPAKRLRKEPPTITEGDWVIVYSSREQLASIMVTAGTQFQSRFGHFKHDDMVGVRWGSKFPSSNGRGFVYLLRPTPELWTLALPHRTQILYLPDIAYITSCLNIRASSRVIEAGTGSGSLSHSLARTVGNKGKVYSFEYHEERFEKAKIEFVEHGLDKIIQVGRRDVYKLGFGVKDEVDSVFLDLPAPWMAIEHAKNALRKDVPTRICCFSPCIEQVIRTCTALAEHSFADITMYETLTRTHDPAQYVLKDVGVSIERILNVEAKKERRREGQIKEAKKRKEAKLRAERGEAPLEEDEAEGVEDKMEVEDGDEDEEAEAGSSKKRARGEGEDERGNGRTPYEEKTFTFKPSGQAKGHTSYLTFATLLPGGKKPVVAPQAVVENKKASSSSSSEKAVEADGEGKVSAPAVEASN